MKSYKSIGFTVLFIFVAVCGMAQQRVVFTPQWIPQAQFAGYYAAKELGFYSAAGLDVEINHPSAAMNALDMLQSGDADIITSMLIDAIANADKGQDIINMMQLMPRSTMMIISHIPLNGSAESLRGKKVVTWKVGFSTILMAIFREKGINVEWVSSLSGVNVFLSESVDAATAMSYNEMQTIAETGFDIRQSHTLRLSDLGYFIPEDGLYTSSTFAQKYPDVILAFREASVQGWEWVAKNREKAVEIVLKVASESNIPTSKYHQSKMLDNLLSEGVEVGSNASYNLRKDDYEQTWALLYRAGIIKNYLSFDSFVFDGVKR